MKKYIYAYIIVVVLFASCSKDEIAPSIDTAQSANSATAAHYIGERFGGGIIFYLTKSGRHGLIAANVDLEEAASWAKKDTVTRATGVALGTGATNTNKIYFALGYPLFEPDSYAAFECLGLNIYGYQDWFLPSKNELHELYKQKDIVGNFKLSTYWSSSEQDVSSAWLENFGTGIQFVQVKTASYSIRPVRQF